jgi:hypothetical protein
MNSGANAPEYADASGGGLSFISKSNITSPTGEWIFDQVFANNPSFNIFEIYAYNLMHDGNVSSGNDDLSMDLRTGASGSEASARSSNALFYHRDRRHGGDGVADSMQTDAAGHEGIRMSRGGTYGAVQNRGTYSKIRVFNPHRKDGNGSTIQARVFVHIMHMGLVNGNGSGSYMYSGETWGNYDNNTLTATGFSLKAAGNNLFATSGCQPMVLIFGVKES